MVGAVNVKRENEKEIKNWFAELAIDLEKVWRIAFLYNPVENP